MKVYNQFLTKLVEESKRFPDRKEDENEFLIAKFTFEDQLLLIPDLRNQLEENFAQISW